ncbi:MAG: hypothetical protein ACPGUV_09315 [Polyangiales bacterium]
MQAKSGERSGLWRIVGTLLLACWVHCGGAASSGPEPAAGGAPQSGATALTPRQLLGRVDAHLQARGFARVGPAQHNRALAENGVMAHAVDAEAGQCYLGVALGDPATDLNLVMLNPLGETEAYDVNPDAHPWAYFCPDQTERHIARLQMARGSGEYYFALYHAGAGVQHALAAFFAQGAPVSAGPPMDSALAARYRSWQEKLAAQGLVAVGQPAPLALGEGAVQSFAISTLRQGKCYAYVLLGAEAHSRLTLRQAETQVATSSPDSGDALLRFCASKPGAHRLEASSTQAAKPYLATFVPKEIGGATAQEAGAPAADSGAQLQQRFRLLDGELVQARGYKRQGDVHRVQDAASLSLPIEAGQCYAVAAAGTESGRWMLQVQDAAQRVLDEAPAMRGQAIGRGCPRSNAPVSVRLDGHQGPALVGLYRWTRGIRGPFGLEGISYVRLAESTALLKVEGYAPDANHAPAREHLAREGASKSRKFSLAGGRCYALLAVGDAGLRDVDLRLSQGGQVLGEAVGRGAFPNVRACLKEQRSVTLQMTAAKGAGKVLVQVFAR